MKKLILTLAIAMGLLGGAVAMSYAVTDVPVAHADSSDCSDGADCL